MKSSVLLTLASSLFVPIRNLASGYGVSTLGAEIVFRATAIAQIVLMALTHPLWLPEDFFPQVPWFAWTAHFSGNAELAAAGMLLVGLVGSALATQRWARQVFVALWLAGGVFLVLFDQHRLQPWFYYGGLVAICWWGFSPVQAAAWHRGLIVTIYLASAMTKLDATFVEQMAPQLMDGLAWSSGFLPQGESGEWATWLMWLFPIGELLAALGLCWPRLRSFMVPVVVLMHLGLIAILGPWGLGHSPAVWIWNVLFIIHVVCLFGPPRPQTQPDANRTSSGIVGRIVLARRFAAQAVLITAFVLPFLEPFGLFDTWPGWGLYAPANERVEVYVQRDALAKLPARLSDADWLPPDWARPEWVRIRIDIWSLHDLAAPLYPQARFGLGVAEALAVRYELRDSIRVKRFGRADRFTGERIEDELVGQEAISAALERNIIGSHSREWLRRQREP